MACRLFGAKPLPEPMQAYCQLDPYEKTLKWISNKYAKSLIHENAFENVVCEMAVIMSRVEMHGQYDTILHSTRQ